MSSHDMKSPTGGVNMGHVMESPDPDEHLLERILSNENVLKAWKRVKANKGAPGIDNTSIEEFPEFARNQWNNIRESILAGTYQPLPVKRLEIPKATGGTRPLGISTVSSYCTSC
jgi:RNA-directed DNA polymerase